MKKILLYCQHILGIGHLIRSMEIARGLVEDFQVCFINGGEIIEGLNIPESLEIVNLPAIKVDTEFSEYKVADNCLTLEEVKEIRQEKLLKLLNNFQPDILIVELFPFGRPYFSFELIPLLDKAKENGVKVVCSLRDIVVTKKDRITYEEKVCQLVDRYFDSVLIHGDPNLVKLEDSFSRIRDLNCEILYTGYVAERPASNSPEKHSDSPTILVSVGGGRFGHELLECTAKMAPILKQELPHHILMFAGPFVPEEVFVKLQNLAAGQNNITVDRYTPELLAYMQRADLSLSMSGYNTTMNILMTGVRAMVLPFIGNGDLEQTIRARRLAELGRLKILSYEDLQPEKLARLVVEYLGQQATKLQFDFGGVEKTVMYLQQLSN